MPYPPLPVGSYGQEARTVDSTNQQLHESSLVPGFPSVNQFDSAETSSTSAGAVKGLDLGPATLAAIYPQMAGKELHFDELGDLIPEFEGDVSSPLSHLPSHTTPAPAVIPLKQSQEPYPAPLPRPTQSYLPPIMEDADSADPAEAPSASTAAGKDKYAQQAPASALPKVLPFHGADDLWHRLVAVTQQMGYGTVDMNQVQTPDCMRLTNACSNNRHHACQL